MYKLNREKIINTFVDLASIPSPSWKEEKVMKYIAKRFKKLKGEITIHPCGISSNLFVKFKGSAKRPSILFSAHMDTVQPCEKITPVVTRTKITSDGTSVLGADDKCAIAMFIEAMEYIQANRIEHGPIEFLITCAEEVGLRGIKCFDLSILQSKLAFVFDSGGNIGRIVNEAPYHSNMKITVHGKASHAGLSPENGINAIQILSKIISSIPSGRIDSETTVNVGLISGGRALNIVPEEAHCLLEARSIDKEKLKKIETGIKETAKSLGKDNGAKVKIERNLEYSGFKIPENSKISKITSMAMKRINIKPEFMAMGGGSDTNILNKGSLKAINLTCGMEQIHSTREYITIRELIKGTELTLSLIETV